MSTEQPAIGVIGPGIIGNQHVERLTASDTPARLGAVHDVDEIRTKEFAERYGVPGPATVEELLGLEDLDAVVIAVPSGLHRDLTIAALQAGNPADRSRIDVVSIPRDLLVDVPACPLPDGRQTAPMAAGTGDGGTRFNAAFAYGGQTGDVAYGAACAILTAEQMTGLYIDDFVVVDFDGFESVIDTIGGVRMCFDEAIDAPKAHLQLQAGCQNIDGETALGVARARVGVDDGSDISRIGRQQELFAAIADEVLGSNLATDTPALLRFMQATADSMTTSERAGNLTTMAGLAYSLRNLDTSDVTFATTPFDWAGNVVVQNADTEALWASLRNSEPMVIPDDDEAGPDDGDPVDPQHSGQSDIDSGNTRDGAGEGTGDGTGDGDSEDPSLDARAAGGTRSAGGAPAAGGARVAGDDRAAGGAPGAVITASVGGRA